MWKVFLSNFPVKRARLFAFFFGLFYWIALIGYGSKHLLLPKLSFKVLDLLNVKTDDVTSGTRNVVPQGPLRAFEVWHRQTEHFFSLISDDGNGYKNVT